MKNKHKIDINKAKEFLKRFQGILEFNNYGYSGFVARFIQHPNFGIIKTAPHEKAFLVAPKIKWDENYVGWLSGSHTKDKLVVYTDNNGTLHSWNDYDEVYDNAELESRVNVLVKEYKNILQNLKIKDIEKDFE